jgi:phosphohistidine phosphatase SixA
VDDVFIASPTIRTIETTNIITSELISANNQELWNTGINTLTESTFEPLGLKLINWIKTLSTKRVFIIAHEGNDSSITQPAGVIRGRLFSYHENSFSLSVVRRWSCAA